MIQIKAKQQNVSFERDVEKLAFVLTAHLYNTLEAGKVIEEAAKRSGMSEGVIKAAWTQRLRSFAPGPPRATTCPCPDWAACASASARSRCRTWRT